MTSHLSANTALIVHGVIILVAFFVLAAIGGTFLARGTMSTQRKPRIFNYLLCGSTVAAFAGILAWMG